MARGRPKAAQITISSDLPKHLGMLRADARALKQMLLNVLSNSIKFTPEGGLVVVRAAEEADGRFTISITDTGIGIAAEDLPKVLSAFGQVNSHLAREGEGTGLGLPLVSSLIERHGGALDIESRPGVGTTVSLRFPAERVLSAGKGRA